MKRPRTWLRVCVGLLLAAGIGLALLWMAAPRLAERLIQRKLVRLGVPVENLHLRSVTPWMLELEPLRLGADPDAPTLGALRVTYVPRELLRAKLRAVVLDGLQFVIRRSKSGAWEVAGADRILLRRADSSTAAQSRSFKQIMDLIPDRVAVQAITVIAETENGRSAFQMELNAERRDDKFDLRVTASGDGKKAAFATVVEAKPELLSCIGKLSSLNIRGLELGEIPLQITADRKAMRVEASVKPPGSALAAKLALSVSLESKTFTGSATLPPALVAESDPALAPFLPASLKGALFSGTLGGRADAVWIAGSAPKCMAEATLADGKFAKDGWTAGITNAVARAGVAPGEQDRGNAYFLELELRGIAACLPDGSLLNAALIQCPLRGSAKAGFEAQCTLRNASLRIPRAELVAEGLDADLAFAWSKEDGLRSVLFPRKTEPGRIRSVNIRGLELGEIPLQIAADGKDLRVEAAIKPPGSALAATLALSVNFESKAFAGSATLPPALVAESDPALAPFLPASLKGARFSGTVGGRAEATWKSGAEPKGAAEVTLAGGKFATADGKFDVQGLECGLKLESLAPLRSFPSQKLKLALAHAAGTTLTDGKFTFRLDPPDIIFVEHGSFVWCGGKLSCAAARITGGKPDGMVILRAEQVDAGQLTGMMKKDFGGHAEGWLTGRVPLIFGKDGVRLGNVHLIGDPEKPGILQLDPEKWPGNQVDTLGVSPAVKKAMKQTLRNMSLTLLRLDALPKTDKTSTRLCLRIAGTPREDTDLPPVDLTLNLNIEDRQNLLWNLMNQSNQEKKPGADADSW